jgi:flavin-dependent dehydrogenase
MQRYDVVVVGAGPAGLFSALSCLKEGLSVLVLEAKPQDKWGARWVVDVEERYFQKGMLPVPNSEAWLQEENPKGVMLPPLPFTPKWSDKTFPIRSINLWRYQLQLAELIRELGGEIWFSARVQDWKRGAKGEVTTILRNREPVLSTGIVIASGVHYSLDKAMYSNFGIIKDITESDCLIAHHQIREMKQPDFLAAPMVFAKAGIVMRMGVAGPMSVEMLRVLPSAGIMLNMAGTIQYDGYATGEQVLSTVPERYSFAGKVLEEGGAPIPARRPLATLAGRGAVIVGNAASQVAAASCSGIGLSAAAAKLVGPRMAAWCRTSDVDRLWRYSVTFHHRHGAELVRQEQFVHFTRNLTEAHVNQMVNRHIVRVGDFYRLQHLGQILPTSFLDPELLEKLISVLKFPAVLPGSLRITRGVLKSFIAYRGYPQHPDPRAIRKWSAKVQKMARLERV